MPRLLPASWLPKCAMKRVIVHWTAGGPTPSEVDLEHYHVLIDAEGRAHRGDYSIAGNVIARDGDYAAHTRGCNSGAIGLTGCGMAEALQSPFTPGPHPLTRACWNGILLAAADLCQAYKIAPDSPHLLMHCEVQAILKIPQRGKWDVSVLTFDRGEYSHLTPGQELRVRVAKLLAR